MPSIILNNAYTHYLTSYASQKVTQFESHKRGDLRNVCRSIVRTNRNTPVCLLGKDEASKANAIDLKEFVRTLNSQLNHLADIVHENPLGQKQAYSSNPEIADAVYIGMNGDEAPTFSLTVHQLAAIQENIGTYLKPEEVGLKPGNYGFQVRVADQNYEFQFSVKEHESNREVQDRLVRLINKARIGLHATTLIDEEGNSAISITARNSGRTARNESMFEVTEMQGEVQEGIHLGATTYLGLNRIAQDAKDAQFEVNGIYKSSPSNHFSVSGQYELLIKKVSSHEDETIIGIKNEADSLVDHVHTLTNSYNAFLDNVERIGQTKGFKSGQILHETTGLAKKAVEDSGGFAGIRMDESGRLQVDEDALQAASGTPDAELNERVKPLKTFAKALRERTEQMAIDPMLYIARPIVAYKAPGREFPSPYISSEYSGMLYSSYC